MYSDAKRLKVQLTATYCTWSSSSSLEKSAAFFWWMCFKCNSTYTSFLLLAGGSATLWATRSNFSLDLERWAGSSRNSDMSRARRGERTRVRLHRPLFICLYKTCRETDESDGADVTRRNPLARGRRGCLSQEEQLLPAAWLTANQQFWQAPRAQSVWSCFCLFWSSLHFD